MLQRGPSRGASHLRQVSAASIDTISTGGGASSVLAATPAPGLTDGQSDKHSVDHGAHQHVASLYRHSCTLWIHDEGFSREDVLFNNSAFSDGGVRLGDVIEITPAPVGRGGGAVGGGAGSGGGVGGLAGSESGLGGDSKSEYGGTTRSSTAVESATEPGSSLHLTSRSKFNSSTQGRFLFVVKPLPADFKQRHPKLEISVTSSVANIFGFKNRMQVLLSVIDRSQCRASHVDIVFRDQYLMRSDMWRLVTSELVDRTIYKGQKIVSMGTIKATVKNIFIGGKKVLSGYFAPDTLPVFRSESARFVLFIQMSREMWDFDSEGTGDILFSRVIDGFLPELFKRWVNLDAKHLVTIVLFTRVEYDMNTREYGASSLNMDALRQAPMSPTDHLHSRDFYRIVVNDMASGYWTTILDELKKNFRTFLRDVSIQKFEKTDPISEIPGKKKQCATIAGHPTSAVRGNILEAIRLATSHLSYDNIDCDMARTGTSIVVITPGTGLFEVSYDSLASTTEALANLGIAIDLVCLSPMPLHSVPLFKYRKPHDQTPPPHSEDLTFLSGTDNRQSGFNLLSRLSPKSPEFSTSSRPHSRAHTAMSSSEWNYGIPHWLDISFWNPQTYRQGRRIAKKDLNAPIPFTLSKASKLFVPRVRMYEIQMMGVMESEQSNISIPYLSEKTYGLQRTLTLHPVLTSHLFASSSNRFPFSPGSLKGQLSDSLRPEPFLSSFTGPKDMILPGSAKHQRRMLSWMDEYDDNVFHAFPKSRRSRKHGKGRRQAETESQTTHAKERLSARSITSMKEREEHGAERTVATPRPRKIDAPAVSSKSTTPAKELTPIKPALKSSRTPRISRSISFALRGLGAAPPRAQPSTEVNAEHAKAVPILNRKSSAVVTDSENKAALSTTDDAASTTSTNESPSGPPTPRKTSENVEIPQSHPISIKAVKKKAQDELNAERNSREGSVNGAETAFQTSNHSSGHGPFPMTRTTSKLDIDMKAGQNDFSTSQSPNRALAPWIRSINPSNTPRASLRDASWFGHWRHAYPRPPHVAVVKWKSLKSPAVLPLTTEEFPSTRELATDYFQAPYRVAPNDEIDANDGNKARDAVLREMVALRLAHGFQIVIGNAVAQVSGQHMLETLNVFDQRGLARDGATIILSKGNVIHRLNCVAGGEIEVTKYSRQLKSASSFDKSGPSTYPAAIRTILSKTYELNNIKLQASHEDYNWNYADNYLAGHRDHLMNPTKQLRFWRTRYVLIPMRLSANVRRHMSTFSEDNEEEIHLLGIHQLTHLWQRHKYVPPEEKRFQTTTRKRKEQNPLNILYQTRDPSEIVAAELDRILLTDPGLDNPPAQLLPDSELLERDSVNLSTLAQMIQGDKGVRMMDRRWHWRLHYNCFIGSEFTTWLLQNFRDIDTREEAVEFGNALLKHGLFQHVEQRHNFRDGNYFYQVASEYRSARPESRAGAGWFPSRRPDKSVPSTPAAEGSKDSPVASEKPVPEAIEEADLSSTTTPTKPKSKLQVYLSKSMRYDVDPRKRSHRPEVIDLHYDRLHNPENCFHIELSWICATPKLVEDAVATWASTAEKYGLKLVQMPIAEAARLVKTHPFRSLYHVKLKVEPPKASPPLSYSATSFSQPVKPDKLYFQKAILRKFDFVLDFEAASAYSPDVEIFYSWGKPDYQYTQYVHRSGCLLAQISDEGDFYFLANRLFSTKSAANRDAAKFDRNERGDTFRLRAATYSYDPMFSPRLSPMIRPLPENGSGGSNNSNNTSVFPSPSNAGSFAIDAANLYKTPELLKTQVEEFCNDADRLRQFYKEAQVRPVSTKVGPSRVSSSDSAMANGINAVAPSRGQAASALSAVLDSSIPSLELPASVVFRHDPASFPAVSSVGNRLSSANSATSDPPTNVENPIAEAMAGSIPSTSNMLGNLNQKQPLPTPGEGGPEDKENSCSGAAAAADNTATTTSTPTTPTATPFTPLKGANASVHKTTVLSPKMLSAGESLEPPGQGTPASSSSSPGQTTHDDTRSDAHDHIGASSEHD